MVRGPENIKITCKSRASLNAKSQRGDPEILMPPSEQERPTWEVAIKNQTGCPWTRNLKGLEGSGPPRVAPATAEASSRGDILGPTFDLATRKLRCVDRRGLCSTSPPGATDDEFGETLHSIICSKGNKDLRLLPGVIFATVLF